MKAQYGKIFVNREVLKIISSSVDGWFYNKSIQEEYNFNTPTMVVFLEASTEEDVPFIDVNYIPILKRRIRRC